MLVSSLSFPSSQGRVVPAALGSLTSHLARPQLPKLLRLCRHPVACPPAVQLLLPGVAVQMIASGSVNRAIKTVSLVRKEVRWSGHAARLRWGEQQQKFHRQLLSVEIWWGLGNFPFSCLEYGTFWSAPEWSDLLPQDRFSS